MSRVEGHETSAHSSGFAGALQKIAAQTGESILDRPVGPTLQCYSIRHMVNLFRWGAAEGDVNHLSGCDPCQAWANNYARSSTARAAQQHVERSWRDDVPAWFKGQGQPVPVTTMLYVKEPLVTIAQTGVSMEVALVAGVTDPNSLDVDSLALEGDLFSKRATLMTQEIAGSQYPVVRFDDIELAESLRRDAQNHVAVVHNVCVTGRFSADKHLTLRGHANVHVGQARVHSV